MTTYWQAEIHHGHDIKTIDFPQRDTADEALWDAREYLSGLTERERWPLSALASEWRTDDGGETSTNTGNVVELND